MGNIEKQWRKKLITAAGWTLLVVNAPPAYAATINVTTLIDEITIDGDCSLREAIRSANTNTAVDACAAGDAGADTINVPAGAIALTVLGVGEDSALTGDLDINSDLSIAGAGTESTIIDGNATDRVFDVFGGATVVIGNLTIANGYTSNDGGAIYNSGNLTHLTVTDVVIRDNYADDDAGAIYNSGPASLAIYNSDLRNNSAVDLGGALRTAVTASAATVRIGNCRITNNSADNFGGAIFVDGGHTLIIDQSELSGNSSVAADGGAIYGEFFSNKGATVVLTRSQINNNNAFDDGGGLFVDNAGLLHVTDTVISGNSAADLGGGIRFDGAAAYFDHVTISYNVVATASVADEGDGGGLYLEGAATITNGSMIIYNTADDDGGGIENFGAYLGVFDSYIGFNRSLGRDNLGFNEGGGIRFSTGAGGAVGNIENVTFENNQAPSAGGAVYNNGALTIRDAQFFGNAATVNGDGGAIYSDEGHVLIANANFYDNFAARKGGAIYAHEDTAGAGVFELYDTSISNNTAVGWGGGLYASTDITVLAVRLSVFGNMATQVGGGLAVSDVASFLLTDSAIYQNTAVLNGGGLAVTSTGNAIIVNATLSANQAWGSGGAVWIADHSSAMLTHVTVADNVADSDSNGSGDGGGVFLLSGSALLANTLLGDNSDNGGEAPNCGGLSLTSLGAVLVADTAGCALAAGLGDIVDQQPLLHGFTHYGGATKTYSLDFTSPAIDAAIAAHCLTHDQRGTARPRGLACDIGAYEYEGSDLLLTLTAAPNAVTWAGATAIQALVLAQGPDLSTAPTLLLQLPAALQFSAAAPAAKCAHDGSTVGGTVTCVLPDLPASASFAVTLDVLAVQGGVATVAGSVTAANVDALLANSQDSVDIQIEDSVDLQLQGQAPSLVANGDTFSLALTAVNAGPNDASGLTVTVATTPAAALEFVGASGGGATCEFADEVVKCQFGDLAVDQERSTTLTYLAKQVAAPTIEAAVFASQTEVNANDNFFTAALDVTDKVTTIRVVANAAANIQDRDVNFDEKNIAMAAFTISGSSDIAVRLAGLTLKANGSGDDAKGIRVVSLIEDVNANGVVDPNEAVLAAGKFGEDNGLMQVQLTPALELAVNQTLTLLVAYDLLGSSPAGAGMVGHRQLRQPPPTALPAAISLMVLLWLLAWRGGRYWAPRRRFAALTVALMLFTWTACEAGRAFTIELPPGATFKLDLIDLDVASDDGATVVNVEGLPLNGATITIK